MWIAFLTAVVTNYPIRINLREEVFVWAQFEVGSISVGKCPVVGSRSQLWRRSTRLLVHIWVGQQMGLGYKPLSLPPLIRNPLSYVDSIFQRFLSLQSSTKHPSLWEKPYV